jgi:hypothetical protein
MVYYKIAQIFWLEKIVQKTVDNNALKTPWVTHGATNKVPEELAVEKSPKASPYGICVGYQRTTSL